MFNFPKDTLFLQHVDLYTLQASLKHLDYMHNVHDGKWEVYTLNANVTNTNIQTDRGFVLLTCTAGI